LDKFKAFTTLSNEELEERMEQETIKENLRQKYVLTGEWENMSLEAKEDAALYERMLLKGAKAYRIRIGDYCIGVLIE
jgi:hypothetical protein